MPPAAKPSIVRSSPVASSITSSSGPSVGGQQLDQVLEPHRRGDAGPVARAAAAAGRRTPRGCGSRASRRRRPASERRRGSGSRARGGAAATSAAPVHALTTPAPERRSRRAARSVSALSFERRTPSGRGDEHRDTRARSGRCAAASPGRSNDDCGQHGVDPLAPADVEQSRPAKPGSEPGGHEVERVAEVPADRALRHVRADEADAPARRSRAAPAGARPFRARRTPRRGSRRSSGGACAIRRCDVVVRASSLDVEPRSDLGAGSGSAPGLRQTASTLPVEVSGRRSRTARPASSRASSRRGRPDLGCQELEPVERPRSSACGQPWRQCWFESER